MTLWQQIKAFFTPPPREMTRHQALARARELWGVTAFAEYVGNECRVGALYRVKGYGPTWEAAFAAAEGWGRGEGA